LGQKPTSFLASIWTILIYSFLGLDVASSKSAFLLPLVRLYFPYGKDAVSLGLDVLHKGRKKTVHAEWDV
jgi:hypothetical protein